MCVCVVRVLFPRPPPLPHAVSHPHPRYFVCRFAGDAWTRLPNVTPHQVAVARKLRRVLTGRLDASVGGHPPFPGTEASYLRARIALITADTVVSPVGAWVCR